MDLEASLNSRHHDFWSISKQVTVSYQKEDGFSMYFCSSQFADGMTDMSIPVEFLRGFWCLYERYLWFWGRIGISVCWCCLTTSSTEKNRQEKPEGRWRGTFTWQWSWLTQLQLNVALVCPPGSLHIFAVFVFAHSLIALSKSKLLIWWCCYYPIIGPIFRMRTTPKTSQDFFLQLGGVRFDPGYDLVNK